MTTPSEKALKAAHEIRVKLSRHWRGFRYYPAEQEIAAAKIIDKYFASEGASQ